MLDAIKNGANDLITAALVIAVGAVLRAIWALQKAVARLEGLDEMRERQLMRDRVSDVRPHGDHQDNPEED